MERHLLEKLAKKDSSIGLRKKINISVETGSHNDDDSLKISINKIPCQAALFDQTSV